MISFVPGTVVRYHTPERKDALGLVLPKDIFLSRFTTERGAWPIGQTYSPQIKTRFGHDLPFSNDVDELSPFEREWMPAGKWSSQRIIAPHQAFLESMYHVGVENIENLFGRTHTYYEIVLAANCKPLEQLSRFHTKLLPAGPIVGYVLQN